MVALFAQTSIVWCLLWALLPPGLADDSDYGEKLSEAEKGLLAVKCSVDCLQRWERPVGQARDEARNLF